MIRPEVLWQLWYPGVPHRPTHPALTESDRNVLNEGMHRNGDRPPRRAVAITGLGVKSPGGSNLDDLWATLCRGESTAAPISGFDPAGLPVRFACEVLDFDPGDYLPFKDLRRVDRFSQLAVGAALDAVADAGLTSGDAERRAVVCGTALGGLMALEAQQRQFIERGPDRLSPYLVAGLMPNAAPALLAILLGWTGQNYGVATACAAGGHAIGEAYRLVRDDIADVALAGGAEAIVTPTGISAFARAGALSRRNDDPGRASRPFDVEADGFVIGEGGAFLVLEPLAAAVARGTHVYGVVAGYAANTDAYHLTAPAPDGAGAAACMSRALGDAQLAPADIAHINAHGTSTPLGDAAEAEAIVRVFGEEPPPVTSSKGVLGHLIGAAGAAEAVASVLALQHGSVPPTANHCRTRPGAALDVVTGQPRAVEGRVLSNSFGFGGHNATLILARAPTPKGSPSAPARCGTET